MSRGAALFPLWYLPHKQHCSTARRVALPGWITKDPYPHNLTDAPDKEIGQNEREQSNEEIANLSDGEFKALVIKMFTDLIEVGHKMKKQMKGTQSEIKQNVQGTNSDRKETWTQSSDLEQKEKINPHPDQNEETRIQKSEETLINLWDNLKHSNIWITGVPEGEEENQEIENLFEQVMKENFPDLAKEIDFQEVQEAQRVPRKLDPKRNTPRYIIIKLPKIKDRRES